MSTQGKNLSKPKPKTPSASPKPPKHQDTTGFDTTVSSTKKKPGTGSITVSDVDRPPSQTGSRVPQALFDTGSMNMSIVGSIGGKQKHQRNSALTHAESYLSDVGELAYHTGTSERMEGGLKILDVITCAKEVLCVRYSPDGRLLAAGQADGVIMLFKASNVTRHHDLGTDDHTPVTCLRFQPTNTEKHFLLSAHASGMVRLWHYTSGKVVKSFNDGRQLLSVAYSPDSTKIITSGTEPAIHMYDAQTLEKVHVFQAGDKRDLMDGHRSRVFATIYHPMMPGTFISGGWDDTVQFWDERQVHSVRNFYGAHICGDALDIDPQHNHILTGSWRKENVLQIWDFGSGEKIKDVPHDHVRSCQMYCCQWMGKEAIISGGSDQNLCRVIDRGTLNTLGQVVDLPSAIYCIDHDHSGSKAKIAAGTGMRIFVLKIEKKDILKRPS